jgi:hypothetical protein
VTGTWRPWDDDAYAPDLELPGVDDEQGISSPMYTVTNPPGTVSVTVYLDGRIHSVELAPKVADMTERELADELHVIAEVARQRARSELHAFIVEGVRMLGHDPAAMRDSLIRELDMPTPEQANAMTAKVFSSRYSSDPEDGR